MTIWLVVSSSRLVSVDVCVCAACLLMRTYPHSLWGPDGSHLALHGAASCPPATTRCQCEYLLCLLWVLTGTHGISWSFERCIFWMNIRSFSNWRKLSWRSQLPLLLLFYSVFLQAPVCFDWTCVLSFLTCTPTGSMWWRPGLVRPRGRGGGRRGPLRGPHCPGCYGNPEEPPGCSNRSRLVGGRPTGGDRFLGSCCQPVWGGDVWAGSCPHWYVNWMTNVHMSSTI